MQAQKIEQELQIFTNMMWKMRMWSVQFFYTRGRCDMPFVWWVYLWFLSPSILVTLAFTFIGRMTFLFWLKYPGSTAFNNGSPSIAEILHLLKVALYSASLYRTGSFIYLFLSLTCHILSPSSIHCIVPNQIIDSPKSWTGIRLHIWVNVCHKLLPGHTICIEKNIL